MPIKYLCDICGAEAPISVNKAITTVEDDNGRVLVLETYPSWQGKKYVYYPDVLKYTAFICNHCIKEAITKERL